MSAETKKKQGFLLGNKWRNLDLSEPKAVEKKDDTGKVVNRLLGYMIGEQNRSRFIIAMVIRVVSTLCLIAIPFFTGQAINAVSNPTDGSQTALMQWVSYAMIAGVLFLLLSVVAERVFSDLATKGLFNLQTSLFAYMQGLSLSFFDRQPLGELMSRLTNDLETVGLFYESAVAQMIRAGIQIILILGVMLLIDWRLTFVALVVVPFMLLLTAVIQRIATPAFAKLQEELGDLSGFQEETIAGNKVLISNRQHEWASAKNEILAANAYDVATSAFFTSLLQFPLTQSLTMVMIVLVLISGGFLVLEGQTTLGVVIAFTGYAALLASPLSEIANLTATSLNAVAGGRRVFTILDEVATVQDAPDAKAYEFKGGHIEFEDVDFSYVPGRKILRHNTFEAKSGQMIGICGPTGAGKSTIMNILTRYYDIDSGTIWIDGQNLATLTQDSLRLQVGMVLQEAFLFSDTVMNNLMYAREGATEEECIAAAKQANAHEFITKLPQGYDTMMTERGANLSQGQRQMITIARAMVAQPKILILDEATSNVDTRTEKLIQEGLRKLMEGRTSFVIAHRLSTIQHAHNIMVINGGEVEEFGPHDELIAKKGFYYKLYMSQFKKDADSEALDTSGFVST